MDKFFASNGVVVVSLIGMTRTEDSLGATLSALSEQSVEALREFFAHERDVELGRWRDLERGNYVVYDLGGTLKGQPRVARVLDERSGFHLDVVDRDDWDDTPFHAGEFAARAYFAAHPEPKPWHAAKPGEVWLLETSGIDDRWNHAAFTVSVVDGETRLIPTEPDYSVTHIGPSATGITGGRRIYPGVSDD